MWAGKVNKFLFHQQLQLRLCSTSHLTPRCSSGGVQQQIAEEALDSQMLIEVGTCVSGKQGEARKEQDYIECCICFLNFILIYYFLFFYFLAFIFKYFSIGLFGQ